MGNMVGNLRETLHRKDPEIQRDLVPTGQVRKQRPASSHEDKQKTEVLNNRVNICGTEGAEVVCPLKIYAKKLEKESRLHHIAVLAILERIEEFIEKEGIR